MRRSASLRIYRTSAVGREVGTRAVAAGPSERGDLGGASVGRGPEAETEAVRAHGRIPVRRSGHSRIRRAPSPRTE